MVEMDGLERRHRSWQRGPRLEEVVDQILFERQVAQPPLPLDPQVLEVLPF